MFSRHAVKVANKRLGIADEKRLCPAYIFCSESATAEHNCTVRQSQHRDSYLKSVAGFLCFLVQLRLFQIIQEEENIEPPADSKQKFFIRWQGQETVNR